MNHYIIPNYTKTVSILNNDRVLPIGKIYCVGKNYIDHVVEMDDGDINEPPFFFTKQPQSLTQNKVIKYPIDTKDLQYEVELVVYIGSKCQSIDSKDVKECILGYSVGIDLTKRDHQSVAKSKRQPWDLSKGFDNSAPISKIFLSDSLINEANIELKLNGKTKQFSNISKMIWSIEDIISNLSKKITLYPGDVIFTGTPSGVGNVVVDDTLEASIEGVGSLKVNFIA
ncbi:fumarylacetoacetate hydrolase family protein [Gammaproteobacteria bacterium]|nr:fumarylacetoacetate hydrolase family protein [Gammaproteobacteria bacterium]